MATIYNPLIVFLCVLHSSNGQSVLDFSKHETDSKVSPCQSCEIFVQSLNYRLKTTASQYDGGNVARLKKNLNDYLSSEVCLTEIQEFLCSDTSEGRAQCYKLVDQYENAIKYWWRQEHKEKVDLFQHFCIDTFQLCCPIGHYGVKCFPCSADLNGMVCAGNGRCQGDGTRQGDGKCVCNSGYTGQHCNKCQPGHYQSFGLLNTVLCNTCHRSCRRSCTGPGANHCEECGTGWMLDPIKGCTDINECVDREVVCTATQFCVNNDGSYSCLNCDKSCAKCYGDGPDMCISCAKGYHFIDGFCIDVDKSRQNEDTTRYITYAGLTLATFIIFNKNTVLASIVGSVVGVYIAVSEFTLRTAYSSSTTY